MSKEDEKIQQIIKETVAHAKNSFFAEDSKIAGHILDKMESRIIATIQKELKPLDTKIDNYIKEDNEWKQMAMPVISTGTRVLNFGVISIALLKFISILGVACGFVYAFFKWIK